MKKNCIEKEPEIIPDHLKLLQTKLLKSEHSRETIKNQLIELSQEANCIQNNQQNQLQGAQALIEHIKNEYEEFIDSTKVEYESFKKFQLQEYDGLKSHYDATKLQLFEEKKKMGQEYQVGFCFYF